VTSSLVAILREVLVCARAAHCSLPMVQRVLKPGGAWGPEHAVGGGRPLGTAASAWSGPSHVGTSVLSVLAFFFSVMEFELRVYTLSHSTSPFFGWIFLS
jgi:hypothetical protein